MNPSTVVYRCDLNRDSEISGSAGRKSQLSRLIEARERGERLVTIFPSEPEEKVERLLASKNGSLIRIGARECEVVLLDRKRCSEFDDQYHMGGSAPASVRYGLVLNEVIVSTMSLTRPRFNKRYEWEISRYTVGRVAVTGGGARLFSAFVADHQPSSVITYSDLRFGTGSTYEKMGFRRLKDSPPNYWYHLGELPLLSRMRFQKHRISSVLNEFDPSLSEWDNMKRDGWDRIWDCGNAAYEWKRDTAPT